MTSRTLRLVVILALLLLFVLAVPSHLVYRVDAGTTAPPPPPPPVVGQFGGPLAGLTSNLTALFNGGYGTFTIKWDPIRGLGPVSTRTGCFTCHGAGVDVLTGTAGDTSNITGMRYGNGIPTELLTISMAPELSRKMKEVQSSTGFRMRLSARFLLAMP